MKNRNSISEKIIKFPGSSFDEVPVIGVWSDEPTRGETKPAVEDGVKLANETEGSKEGELDLAFMSFINEKDDVRRRKAFDNVERMKAKKRQSAVEQKRAEAIEADNKARRTFMAVMAGTAALIAVAVGFKMNSDAKDNQSPYERDGYSTTTEIVQPGDTLWNMANDQMTEDGIRNEIDIRDYIDAIQDYPGNTEVDFANLKPGDVIVLPDDPNTPAEK